MIQVDRNKVKAEWRNAEYRTGLEELLTKVAMLKPLAKFEVSDKGIEVKHLRENDEVVSKPLMICESKPRPAILNTNCPCTSSQARTQRKQLIHFHLMLTDLPFL